MRGLVPKKPKPRRLVPTKTKTIWRTQVRKFHFSSICNVLPCELRLFWYSTRVLNRHLANKLPTCGQQLADCRSTVGRLSSDCRSTVGQQSADSFFGELFFIFSMETGFLYKFQSGFRPGDSTINQLIFLVHKIYEALEDGKEVRAVFLDISKAFDKVWHAGLLRKLEALGVQSPLLQWFESYLCNRKQRVVIEGQCSDWRTITSGVPQGSVLGPLLFLIYINDITDDLASLPLIYADDTTLLEIVDDPVVSAGRLNSDLHKISVWADKWLVTMNPVKSRNVIFSLKRNKQVHPPLFLSSNIVKDVESHTHLGLTLQSSMSWRKHIVQVFEKASKRLNMLKFVRFKVDRSILTSLYKSLIRPLMEYGDVIWNNCYDCDSALLDGVQYEAARLVTGAIKGTSSARLYKELAWESLSNRRKLHLLCQFYKIVKNLAPYYLSEMLPKLSSERTNYRLRSRENFTQFSCRTSRFQKSFFPSAITGWNSLDIDV